MQPAAWPLLQRRLVDALLQLDAAAAEAVLGQAFAHYALDDVCFKLIEPTLVTIGEGWHQGVVSVGQEHFATQLLRRRIGALLSVYDAPAGYTTVVCACAPGEQHDMGLLLLALVLVRRGYRVLYLGADVPVGGLLPVVEQMAADVVCLSASTTVTAAGVRAVAEALQRLPRPPLVIAGGRGMRGIAAVEGLYVRLDGSALAVADRIAALIANRRETTGER